MVTVQNVKNASKEKKPTKKRPTAFGDLQKFYEIANKIHQHRVYKLFKHVPDPLIAGFSHLLARIFFGSSKKLVSRMRGSVQALAARPYPAWFSRKLADANLKHMGVLLFDLMLKAPNYDEKNYTRVARFEGLEYLDKALAMGKGVLMPSIHVGEFFHCIGGLLLKGYEIAAVGNMQNRLVFERLMTFPQYRKLHAVGRDSYEKIHEELVGHLKQNHIVFLMHDIARRHNLRTPFVHGMRDYLVPTPQGIVALQRETGAPVVPIVAVPDGRFTRSIVTIVDPSGIEATIQAHKGDPAPAFHGQLSTAINKALFPYILRFPHCHEELTGIGSYLLDHAIKFPAKAILPDVLATVAEFVAALVKGSFEPGRADEPLLAWLEEGWKHGREVLACSNVPVFMLPNKASIKIGGRTTREQISKVLFVLARLFRRASMPELEEYYITRNASVPKFFDNRK